MMAAPDVAPPLTITGLEAARTCVRAAVMYDDERKSYALIARMLGLRDADHARRAADVARSTIEAGDGGNT